MKKSPLILAAMITVAAPITLPAADRYWDIDGATAGAGGATPTGNWNTGTANWTSDPLGEIDGITWVDGDSAIFSAGTDATGTFTVTTTAAQTAASITVEEGIVQHAGSSTNKLTTSGLTINNGGTFSVAIALSFTPTAGSVCTLNGGTIQNRNGGVGSSFFTSGGANTNMSIVLGTGGGHISVTGASTAISIYTGLISGTGPLTIDGTNNAIFRLTTTPATYSGATIITNGGKLQVSTTADVLPAGTALTIDSGGIFDLQANQTVGSLAGGGTLTNNVASASRTLTAGGDNTSTVFSGVIQNGTTNAPVALTKAGSGTLTLTGANTATGTITINSVAGNTVSVGDGGTTGSIAANVATTTNGALVFNRSDASSYNGLVSGAGTVRKEGAGVLTISNNDWTNTGGVVINGGQITYGNSSAGFAATVPVTINNGAALDMNNIGDTFGSLVSSAANTSGELKLSGNLTLGQTATTGRNYFGTITGGAQLTKGGGTWTQTLSGDNSTYSGNIVVSLGKIAVANANALGTTAGTTSVASGAELLFDGAANSYTIAEPISIAGVGADGGAITVQNSSNTTFSGPITLTADATVTTSSTATSTYSNASAFTGTDVTLTLQGGSGGGGGGTISGAIALGTGGLIKLQSGTWTLSGANTYTGTTTISAGTLQLGTGLNGEDGTISSSPSIVNNSALVFNRFGNDSYAGIISGTGSVTKSGAGTQTLSGTNTYVGATTVSSGTLKLGSVAALGFGGRQTTTSTASTSVSAGATLDSNGSVINEPIVLNGSGVGGSGALINGSATVAAIDSGIAGVQLPAATTGSGYSAAPTISFTGTGSGAAATATLGVTAASFTLDFGDKFYTTAPTVTISGGGGSGATATAVLSGGATGTLTGITFTNAGTGFTTAPTITFGAGVFSSGTISASGTGNATEFTVTGLNMTAPGSGYTGTPTYAFDSGNATPGTVTLSSVTLATDSSIGGTGDIEIKSAISQTGTGKTLTKTGSGTLVISGPQSYSSLLVDAGTATLDSSLPDATITNESGTLNIKANANDSTVNANSTGGTYFGSDQTLTALNIGAGGVVILGGAPPPAPAAEEPALAMTAQGAPVVPEPGSVSLLMAGALGFLLRRRRKDAQA